MAVPGAATAQIVEGLAGAAAAPLSVRKRTRMSVELYDIGSMVNPEPSRLNPLGSVRSSRSSQRKELRLHDGARRGRRRRRDCELLTTITSRKDGIADGYEARRRPRDGRRAGPRPCGFRT